MQQRGFTLIELIIVIVILGILAVTAAPKFIDIQSDATGATLQGVKASLNTGAQMVYAKSAIAGEQKNANDATDASAVTVGGVAVETDFGYPDAEKMTMAMLAGFVDLDTTNDWTLSTGTTNGNTTGTFTITPGTTAPTLATDTCHVIYTDAEDANTPPVITLVTTGC